MAKQESRNLDRSTADQFFGEALRNTLIEKKAKRGFFRKKDISPQQLPEVNPSPIYDSSYSLGYATAKEGDSFSLNLSNVGHTVAAGVSIVQDQLGSKANKALGDATHKIKLAEGRIRANSKKLPRFLIPFILIATVVLDAVVANRALESAFNIDPILVITASLAIALLMALTGFVMALTAVRLLGHGALWISLIASLIAVISFGWVSTEYRGAFSESDNANKALNEITRQLSSDPTDAQAKSAVTKAIERRDTADKEEQKFLMYLFGTLILFTVSAATLAKAYEANQQNEVVDKRTVHRQEQRSQDLALGLSLVTDLRAWPPLADSVQEVGRLGLARYVDGYRSGLSAEQLDHFTNQPPKVAEVQEIKWTQDFSQRVDNLEESLRRFEDDLGMPQTS
jgi:hypothetical protein